MKKRDCSLRQWNPYGWPGAKVLRAHFAVARAVLRKRLEPANLAGVVQQPVKCAPSRSALPLRTLQEADEGAGQGLLEVRSWSESIK